MLSDLPVIGSGAVYAALWTGMPVPSGDAFQVVAAMPSAALLPAETAALSRPDSFDPQWPFG
ncbi:hypothetical protein [Micromonospora sp. NPDC049282]|uniref:hypothetical protein n=1 Tax=Micromonospora sp. NPDC049282 TaxID=3364269 RepID=UPI003716E0DE